MWCVALNIMWVLPVCLAPSWAAAHYTISVQAMAKLRGGFASPTTSAPTPGVSAARQPCYQQLTAIFCFENPVATSIFSTYRYCNVPVQCTLYLYLSLNKDQFMLVKYYPSGGFNGGGERSWKVPAWSEWFVSCISTQLMSQKPLEIVKLFVF